ncbi:hypothetical protein Pelo_7416 [Pelomyxa schiedti]|nr:hypothetical protein Pelo_7416 [Pelomyxa schiedti]
MSELVWGPPPKRSRKSQEAMPWQGTPNLAGIRARDQVAALLLATHPRCCGVRSGRKGAVRLTWQAVRRLWDDWVMGCVRMFAIESKVSRSRTGQPIKRTCVWGIGISMLLMGITHELVVMEAQFRWNLGVARGVKWVSRRELRLRDELMGIDTLVYAEKLDDSMYLSGDNWCCVNSKWFVACCSGKRTRESRIILGSLPTQRGAAVADHVFPFPHEMVCGFVGLNKFVENEAFQLLYDPAGEALTDIFKYELTLWIIDLAASWATKTLKMTSIKWMSSSPGSRIRCLLPMRKSNGQAIFIASFSPRPRQCPIYAVEPSGAQETIETSIPNRGARGLSQLSESLFCVIQKTQVLVWDCNNLHNAISCIQVPHMDFFMIGLGFFLKVSDDKKKLHVIDASSDMKSVATVEFLLPGGSGGHQHHNTQLQQRQQQPQQQSTTTAGVKRPRPRGTTTAGDDDDDHEPGDPPPPHNVDHDHHHHQSITSPARGSTLIPSAGTVEIIPRPHLAKCRIGFHESMEVLEESLLKSTPEFRIPIERMP